MNLTKLQRLERGEEVRVRNECTASRLFEELDSQHPESYTVNRGRGGYHIRLTPQRLADLTESPTPHWQHERWLLVIQEPCPECGEPIKLNTWTEWHPFGSTVAGEPMADIDPSCDCDISDDTIQEICDRLIQMLQA
jgi:hypothetical protein